MKEERCTANDNSDLKKLAKDILVEHAVKALTGQEIDFADEIEKEFVERDAQCGGERKSLIVKETDLRRK